jgi:hypothetical protein
MVLNPPDGNPFPDSHQEKRQHRQERAGFWRSRAGSIIGQQSRSAASHAKEVLGRAFGWFLTNLLSGPQNPRSLSVKGP